MERDVSVTTLHLELQPVWLEEIKKKYAAVREILFLCYLSLPTLHVDKFLQYYNYCKMRVE